MSAVLILRSFKKNTSKEKVVSALSEFLFEDTSILVKFDKNFFDVVFTGVSEEIGFDGKNFCIILFLLSQSAYLSSFMSSECVI